MPTECVSAENCCFISTVSHSNTYETCEDLRFFYFPSNTSRTVLVTRLYACVFPGSPWAIDRWGSSVHHHLYGKRAEEEEEEEVQPLGSTVHLHRIHLSGKQHVTLRVEPVILLLVETKWKVGIINRENHNCFRSDSLRKEKRREREGLCVCFEGVLTRCFQPSWQKCNIPH